MAEDLPAFVHSVCFPFLLAVACLEVSDGQERAVSEIEE